MSSLRPQVWNGSGPYFQRQLDADTLIVGAGITTSSGNLAVGSAGGTTNLNDAVVIAANKNWSVSAGTTAFDLSGGTGLFKTTTGAATIGGGSATISITSSGAAVTITAGAASTWSTSSGALTLTSAAAATWSTSAGALTLSGASGINLQGSGATALAINSTGSTMTIQAGTTLTTSGSGQINLPNNGSSRFSIEGAGVSSAVTAANLGTLTAGSSSNADALHTHVLAGATVVNDSGLTLWSTPALGEVGYMTSTDSTLAKAKADAIGTARFYGVYNGTAGQVVVAGVVGVLFSSGLTSIVAGTPVFLSAATAGQVTNVAPSTTGQVVSQLGILKVAAGYSNASGSVQSVLLQPKSPLVL